MSIDDKLKELNMSVQVTRVAHRTAREQAKKDLAKYGVKLIERNSK